MLPLRNNFLACLCLLFFSFGVYGQQSEADTVSQGEYPFINYGADTLIIDNNNLATHGQCSTLIPTGTPSLNSFSNVIIKGNIIVALCALQALPLTEDTV